MKRGDAAAATFSDESRRRGGDKSPRARYVSPEVLQGEATTPACDLWALGCLVYQLSCGGLPFRAPTDFLLWEKIVAFADGDDDEFEVAEHVPDAALDAAKRLMVKDAAHRLGSFGKWKVLEAHPFFAPARVADVAAGNVKPPWTPAVPKREASEVFADFSIESAPGRATKTAFRLHVPRAPRGAVFLNML